MRLPKWDSITQADAINFRHDALNWVHNGDGREPTQRRVDLTLETAVGDKPGPPLLVRPRCPRARLAINGKPL